MTPTRTVVDRRRRADNRLVVPPPPTRRTTLAADLVLDHAGRTIRVGGAIDGEVEWEATTDQAATLTVPVRDAGGGLRAVLVDRQGVARDGVRTTVDGDLYTLVGWQVTDSDLVTLTFEDDVAWRLRQQTVRVVATRGQLTRAGFVRRLCEKAAAGGPAIRVFIPEVSDRQPVAKGA